MKEGQPLTDWEYLAETGWREMREMLLQPPALTPEVTPRMPVRHFVSSKNHWVPAASLLFILLFNIFPAAVTDPAGTPKNTQTAGAEKIRINKTDLDKISRPAGLALCKDQAA